LTTMITRESTDDRQGGNQRQVDGEPLDGKLLSAQKLKNYQT
jgi:hypothetical protein